MYIALLMLLLAYLLTKEHVPRAVGRVLQSRLTDTIRPVRPVQQEYG